MKTTRFILLLVLIGACAPFAKADDPAPTAESRLRQALRDNMLQLRDAQNQVVTLQAAKDQDDKDKADLQAKLDALTAQLKSVTDQAAADKSTADKAIEDLKSQVVDLTGQIGRLNDGLKQWKDAYNQTAQLAAARDTENKQLVMQAALLQRTVDDRETKNLALYKLGGEILTRYEQFGLGDALAAKEPFVGLSRVKLETLVQDYKNKLLDHAVTSGQTPPPTEPLPDKPAPDVSKQTKSGGTPSARPVNPT